MATYQVCYGHDHGSRVVISADAFRHDPGQPLVFFNTQENGSEVEVACFFSPLWFRKTPDTNAFDDCGD